jgi:UDP-glucuronate 4-epimerase
MAQSRYLVTGALGCIGAWVVRNLVQQNMDTTIFDLGTNTQRLKLIMTPDELSRIRTAEGGDITQPDLLKRAFSENGITHVIHLAALQVPFCRANPTLGAQVNVTGTINVFEAVKSAGLKHLVYASSVAIYGPRDMYPPGLLAHDAPAAPGNLYGVYKLANEGTARIYHAENGINSIGIRPYTIYGPGRDQGMTSSPTMAMLAAAKGEAFNISFGGMGAYQHADDVAKVFVQAATAPYEGAGVFNLKGHIAPMTEVVAAINAAAPEVAGKITFDDKPLSLPDGADDSELRKVPGIQIIERPLKQGIADTITHFRQALANGLIN